MLCIAQDSVLVVIDVQERLVCAMLDEVVSPLKTNIGVLLKAASLLKIPTIMTLQYPKGLGQAAIDITKIPLEQIKLFEKTGFSCMAMPNFVAYLSALQRRQIILTGMEAHICVLQTALELRQAAYEVFSVEDAICSRRQGSYENAIRRMHYAGVQSVTTESVLFEWLKDAKHAHFKSLSRLII